MERGLLPKPDSFVFASKHRLIALVFAAARAELEDDYGLIVQFHSEAECIEDPQFPDSIKIKSKISPEDIQQLDLVDLEEEYRAYHWLETFVASIKLESNESPGEL